ncbi:hypothetical protein [Zestomonas carbonaria]|uniref:Uncharacterized protein n=1 Tax=Zestomonas carbonaria TaxID=2762745 RepID=A0A7U7EQY5_9GAMM|nr:hypothetical protein [Pseudomonas carbonaria]CAD5109548.1 hypothetical protein PSEWESI4_03853 [Pseudomonas carbonaria]
MENDPGLERAEEASGNASREEKRASVGFWLKAGKSFIELLGKHPFATGLLALLSIVGFAFSIYQYIDAKNDSRVASEQAARIEKKIEVAGGGVSSDYVPRIRAVLSSECKSIVPKMGRLVEEQQEIRRADWEFNSYALPKMSASILKQVSENPALLGADDPDIGEVVRVAGAIDYDHVFSLRRATGTINKHEIADYILNLHYLCDWAGVDLGQRQLFLQQ